MVWLQRGHRWAVVPICELQPIPGVPQWQHLSGQGLGAPLFESGLQSAPTKASQRRFAQARIHAGPDSHEFKLELAMQLYEQLSEVPTGPVAIEISYIVGARPADWTLLWKPTIDCLEGIVGRDPRGRDFHPLDDRITQLRLHSVRNPDIGKAVHVGIWWGIDSTFESGPK
jgi:hypothetical protein